MAGDESDVVRLGPSEFLAKCALYPRYLRDGIFASEALLDLGKDGRGSKPPFVISCASRTLLPQVQQVHEFGCRRATKANERKAERLGRNLERPGETCHYRGFYDLLVGQVTGIPSNAYKIEVVLLPEDGEEAHCNIVLRPEEATKTQLRTERTDILIQISARLRGPTLHISPSDLDLVYFLSPLALPVFSDEPGPL